MGFDQEEGNLKPPNHSVLHLGGLPDTTTSIHPDLLAHPSQGILHLQEQDK
jgi:hypothetical protein